MTDNESSNKEDKTDDNLNSQNSDSAKPGSEDKGAPQKSSEKQAASNKQSDNLNLTDTPRVSALEVSVDQNIEKAMKILKRKLIKEGLFKELKLRRYYEKPSERKKRKLKESLKKLRKEESRMKKNSFL